MRARLSRWLTRGLFQGVAGGWMPPVVARTLPAAAVVLASSLIAAGVGLMLPLLTKQVIDQGIMARDMPALLRWSALAFVLGLLSVALGMVNSLLHLRASARMLADLRLTVTDAAMARDPAQPDLPLGEAMTRLDGDCATIQSFAFDSVLVAVGALFRLVGGLGLMLALDWRLALLPAVFAPLELAFLSRARRRTQALAEQSRGLRGDLSSLLAENLSAAPMLRAMGAVGARQADLAQVQRLQIGQLLRQRLWGETVGAVSQILAALTRAAVLLIGGWLVIRGEWQIGTLVAFLAYAGMLSGPLRNLLGLYHAQAMARVAMGRLDGVVSAARPGHGDDPLPGALVFCGARAVGALHAPVTATILPGSRVLIDGPSGIGKSRLLALASRAAPLEQGAVTLGGVDVTTLRPDALADHITHLDQRPAVLRGSIGDNLRLAAPDADDDRLWRALRVADLADWAQAAGGLSAAVAETGANLSGGMRQKIALARAVLRPARIMIFDESFSELDQSSCRRILAALDAALADRVRIFIAHAGPVREGRFDQRITLSSSAPERRNSRGGTPYQRANAREKAVWSE
ncbi:MAG: ABC transporter ATP-binding protein [Paracoccus sp. (in: a-proteobacteria)]|uniref:ABC transporter ATP-binding protein n=1 Tax=Paracoccus sp. TaxID=267 RepID=UPI0026DF823A|nr:ABC transporter ATP-binding protein [Paracoccus sp. (in: a-proteobacteria)]MDO5620013.1 ABC transporter ATP-binding protein [Paracoccus sp. (in: a-proteobacteria)]